MGLMIYDLNVSKRCVNTLSEAAIRSVNDVIRYSSEQLLKVRNFNEECLAELKSALADIGLKLRS